MTLEEEEESAAMQVKLYRKHLEQSVSVGQRCNKKYSCNSRIYKTPKQAPNAILKGISQYSITRQLGIPFIAIKENKKNGLNDNIE